MDKRQKEIRNEITLKFIEYMNEDTDRNFLEFRAYEKAINDIYNLQGDAIRLITLPRSRKVLDALRDAMNELIKEDEQVRDYVSRNYKPIE